MQNAAAESKDDGTFVLDGVPGGDALVIVTAKGHASGEVAVTVNEDTPPVEIGLGRAAESREWSLHRMARLSAGTLMLTGPELHGSGTDETGSFAFAHVAPGHYRLTANTRAGAPGWSSSWGRTKSGKASC